MGMAQIQFFEVSLSTLTVPVHGHISPHVHVTIVQTTMDTRGPGPRVAISILNAHKVMKKHYFHYISPIDLTDSPRPLFPSNLTSISHRRFHLKVWQP